MVILKIIGRTILYIIGIVILATIMAIGTIFIYFYLQMLLFGRGDYLLFVSGDLNMIPVIMILILIVYAFIRLKERFFRSKEIITETIEADEEPIDIESLGKITRFILKIVDKSVVHDVTIVKIFKVIKICYALILIIAIYCGMTSYAILYSDSIKVSSPIVPTGVIYKYNDVKSIVVGVEKENRNSYSPYYKVILSAGKSVNLIGGSMIEDTGKGFEYILIDLDKKLRAQGVSKKVSKVNFEEYSKGLDKDFVSRIAKLFDDK